MTNIEKEAMLKIFPGINEDSQCFIKPVKSNVDRFGLYYNEICIAILSKDMEKEYKDYIESKK